MKEKKESNFRIYLIISLIVIILGSILLIINRKLPIKIEEDIKFHETEATLYIGETKQVGYTIYNKSANDNLSWATSNAKVATVDENGLIRAISFGDVTISAVLNNKYVATMKVSIKSYEVSLRIIPNYKRSNGEWYNKQLEVEIKTLNVGKLKYCVTTADVCTPNKDYQKKITLKNGTWSLYIEALDKNNREFTHKEMIKIDNVAPKCKISRIGKITDLSTTITVSCEPDDSGITKYEWYRDNSIVLVTNQNEIEMTQISDGGNHKYQVKVYDEALNISTYKIN